MHSLKTKLVLTISALVIVLFVGSTVVYIGEKQREIVYDINFELVNFGELTAPAIATSYKTYLEANSFIYFNRELSDVFQKMEDLSRIQIVNYKGEIVYDSETDKDRKYEGTPRLITDPELLSQVQSRNPSIVTLDSGRRVFMKENKSGIEYVDVNEKSVLPPGDSEKVKYLVQPASQELAIVYYVSYTTLQERINATVIRGLMLAGFGIGIGILMAFLYAGSITRPLKKLTESAGIIAKGDFKHRVNVKTKDEIEILANAFNKMTEELELSTKALVYKERVAKELELAAKIQKEILPKSIPQMPGLDIAAGLLPAEEIGGDSYDFIKTNDNELLMYLGDVTGHGVPSGIVVSVANALIYNYARDNELKELLINVNRILKDKTTSNMFMTLVLLKWNSALQQLKYVSAGHEQMIHYHASEKKLTLTPAGGVALGMLTDISKTLREDEVKMEKGDVLVIYSDGIPECWKNENEMYGMGRLKRAVQEYSELPSALALRNALLADVKGFAGKYKQMDDITLIVLRKN